MLFGLIVTAAALKAALGVVGTSLWLVPLLIAGMAYYRYDAVDPESQPIDQYPLYKEYDFVVVGGGSAGAVVANRLSEITKWTVLLMEAGEDENEITDVPSLAAYLQLTNMDWQYKTEPTGRACLGMKGGRCNWPRGKVLGGSSVLNYMLYVRGNRYDYDHWASLGNYGWGYNDILKYFKKSEDNRNPYLARTNYHSAGGYLTVQESPWRTPLAIAFLEAGMEIGYENRDINGEKQTGFMIAQGTIRRGSRCSTAKAFLRPVHLRKNIHIALKSHVMRILINPVTMRAYGVLFIRNGVRQIVLARREVILSAGAINSAQILLLSGIGPKEHLDKVGIPTLRNLKVGENLQDHVGMGGLTFLVDKPVSIVQERFQTIPVSLEYIMHQRGPMTTLGGVEGLAFVNTPYANISGLYPDIQFHFAPASVNSDAGVQMGPSWDLDAVVDPNLRVYGVKGLRVIDASIMPTIVSGNTNAPVIMIGEKGADLIKQDWLNWKS
uniref:Glucose-methanol-choline oxidoreductase N-terminal domain-containing protein n=1 Tax=Timema cristinae TaxID=61476 RepID=A0A7R9CBR2_TIMCR|nr:unnamed protein product [Timema cristinae]